MNKVRHQGHSIILSRHGAGVITSISIHPGKLSSVIRELYPIIGANDSTLRQYASNYPKFEMLPQSKREKSGLSLVCKQCELTNEPNQLSDYISRMDLFAISKHDFITVVKALVK